MSSNLSVKNANPSFLYPIETKGVCSANPFRFGEELKRDSNGADRMSVPYSFATAARSNSAPEREIPEVSAHLFPAP